MIICVVYYMQRTDKSVVCSISQCCREMPASKVFSICLLFLTATTFSLDRPYIRLEKVLDEPYGYGWGIDLPGYGDTMQFTDVQTHTLKPGNASTSGDMNQVLEGDLIMFLNDGEGHCMQVMNTNDD